MSGIEAGKSSTTAAESTEEILDGRLEWSRPLLKRMNLSSAENNLFTPGNDGIPGKS